MATPIRTGLLLLFACQTVAFSTPPFHGLFRSCKIVDTNIPWTVNAIPNSRVVAKTSSMVRRRLPSVLMSTDGSENGKVDEVELIKIFGRLAEKTLFGDGSAGQCCHSGCSDCEWRYSFDILQSARPKWIPSYRYLFDTE
jgi:hypothetical protein